MEVFKNIRHKHIFVFGSNLGGRHGKGAALFARDNYGAVYGEGAGRTGNAYGIPTKDVNLKILSLDMIETHVKVFNMYTFDHPNLIFLVTPFGTGLAGYNKLDIIAIMQKLVWTRNVLFTKEWMNL
ncbi:MAG: hypothetical protein COA84_13855 [Robiginitomaculum sp.]|nr:MAG: hypothetical protein COA84_13855 [Robiginitomaculum sp.]